MRTLNFFFAVVGIFLCLLSARSTVAATWYVDASILLPGDGKSWQTAFRGIQEGIDAASDGDTVLVGPGTYREMIKFSGKQIELRSRDGVDATILSTEYNGPVVTFDQGESDKAVMSGFTIRDGTSWGGDGGGIVCIGSSPTLIDCIIRQNTASGSYPHGRGGGVYCLQGSPTFSQCVIADNWADREGGGIYAEESSSLTLRNCVVSTNRSGSYFGGGVCCQESALTLTDCEILENTGGVWCSGALLATDCTVARNSPVASTTALSTSRKARRESGIFAHTLSTISSTSLRSPSFSRSLSISSRSFPSPTLRFSGKISYSTSPNPPLKKSHTPGKCRLRLACSSRDAKAHPSAPSMRRHGPTIGGIVHDSPPLWRDKRRAALRVARPCKTCANRRDWGLSRR